MTLTAREHKVGIAAVLHMGAQQRLNILLGIVHHLLELVNSNQAVHVCLLYTLEYLIKRIFWIADIAQLNIERRHTGNGIVTKTAAQRTQCAHHTLHPPLSATADGIEHRLSQ